MKQRFTRWVSLLTVCLMLALYCTTAQAALLDVGPTVPQVLGSTEPNVGHGFPLWYRDNNRLSLELCMDQAMCFFAPPTPAPAAVTFPANFPDEAFYYAAESIITLPGIGKRAILVQAIEAAFSTGNVVPGAQVTFARLRIRIDTPVAGTYLVTTPYKQFTYNVTDVAAGINYTEDVGIAEGGVFTGALSGTIGPFLSCTNGPFVTPTGTYIGDGVPCPVQGSTFTDPRTGAPANLFRIEGPLGANLNGAGSNVVESRLFSVNGKINLTVIPTPLTVDKATYALAAGVMQVNVFATTQAISNQTVPGSLLLNNTPSALQLGVGTTTQPMMTHTPPDGKFFLFSEFPAPTTVPATVTVTNTADVPDTVQTVPLVDEVVINAATYNPLTKVLAIKASSSDKVTLPALLAFMPGMTAPLPGGLNVTFPVIDTTVTPNKTYAFPTSAITVTSAKGGSATAPVTVSTFVPPPPLVISTATLANGVAGTLYSQTATATGGTAPRLWTVAVGSTLPAGLTLSTAGVLSGTPTAAGTFTFGLQVTDSQAPAVTTAKAFTVVVAPAAGVIPAPLVITAATPLTSGVVGAAYNRTATATGGTAPYTWTVAVGTLPAGLTLSPAGVLSGTPTAAGTFTFSLRVTDSLAVTTVKAFNVVVTATAPVVSPATGVNIVNLTGATKANVGAAVTFTAARTGGDAGPYEYRFFYRRSNTTVFTDGRAYSTTPTWTWNTAGLPKDNYVVRVNVRHVGSTAAFEANRSINFQLQ